MVFLCALCVSVVSASSALAAEWWVDFESGVDASPTDTGTPAAPRRTVPLTANIADGDSIYCRAGGTLRPGKTYATPALVYIQNKDGVTLQGFWPGETGACTIRGDIDITGESWANDAGDRYVATLGTLTAPPVYNASNVAVGVTWNYDASVNGNGHRFGHLRHVASAAAVTSTAWSFFWDDTEKDLYINLDGADPASGTVTIVNAHDKSLIGIDGCADAVVRGFRLEVCPAYVEAYGVFMNQCAGGLVEDLDCEDVGTHAVTWWNCSGANSTRRVSGAGMTIDGKWIVHYTPDDNPITGARVRGCVWTPKGWLNPLGAQVEALNGQSLGFAHAVSSTDRVLSVQYEACTAAGVAAYLTVGAASAVPFDVQNVAAVDAGDAWDYTAYPFRAVGCTVTGWGIMGQLPGGYIAYHRCRIEQTATLLGPVTDGLLRYVLTGAGRMLFSSSELSINLDAGNVGNYESYAATRFNVATQNFHWLNCTIWNPGVEAATNFRAFFTYNVNQPQFHVRGCIIGHANETNVSALCVGDGSVSAANHDFLDNRYIGINDANGRWSQNGSFNTEANWVASVDTTGDELASSPFAAAPANFKLLPASGLRTSDKSVRSSPAPAFGFNGRTYDGTYGAWQYGALPGAGSGVRGIIDLIVRGVIR